MDVSVAQGFGAVLATARTERGLTQEQLAEKSGLHRTYISLIERGARQPTLSVLFDLSAALGVQPSTLVRRTERLASSD